jgi:hypothetical protein
MKNKIMNKFFYQSIVSLIGLIMVLSCTPSKNEIADKKDTLINEANRAEQDSLDDFNNQDNGDPGLSAMIVDFENLEPDIKDFLLRLDVSKIEEVLQAGKDFLLLSPGPGVYPIVEFGNSSKDLLVIKEVKVFLADSAYDELNVYRALPDKCIVIEGYPDGIYFGYSDFKRFSSLNPNSDNETLNKKLNAFTKETNEKSGYEFVFKFTSTEGESLFINILTYKKDGKLFIGAVDQRDCGT